MITRPPQRFAIPWKKKQVNWHLFELVKETGYNVFNSFKYDYPQEYLLNTLTFTMKNQITLCTSP